MEVDDNEVRRLVKSMLLVLGKNWIIPVVNPEPSIIILTGAYPPPLDSPYKDSAIHIFCVFSPNEVASAVDFGKMIDTPCQIILTVRVRGTKKPFCTTPKDSPPMDLAHLFVFSKNANIFTKENGLSSSLVSSRIGKEDLDLNEVSIKGFDNSRVIPGEAWMKILSIFKTPQKPCIIALPGTSGDILIPALHHQYSVCMFQISQAIVDALSSPIITALTRAVGNGIVTKLPSKPVQVVANATVSLKRKNSQTLELELPTKKARGNSLEVEVAAGDDEMGLNGELENNADDKAEEDDETSLNSAEEILHDAWI